MTQTTGAPAAPHGHTTRISLPPAGVNANPPDSQALWLPLRRAQQAASGLIAWPFDLLRAQYGLAVQLGLARRSMLDAREVERLLARWERATLGALARRV